MRKNLGISLNGVDFRGSGGERARSPRDSRPERPRYCKSNRANFVYFGPFGDKWLWYKKKAWAVMVPKSGVGMVDSFACRYSNMRLEVSVWLRRGEAERPAARASVRWGVKARSSFGIPSNASLMSMAAAKAGN